MKSIMLVATMAAMLPHQPTFAKAAKKTLRLEGVEYPTARRIILGYGWKPVPGNCGGGGIDEEGCARFPEVGNCSGVWPAYCDMHFARRNRCLDLVTMHGAPQGLPGDIHVRDVTFSRGPCVKNRD